MPHQRRPSQSQLAAATIFAACRGYRALGFAMAERGGAPDAPGTKWEFLGLLPLFDPPRHDTAETIEKCQDMGIGGKGDPAVVLCD